MSPRAVAAALLLAAAAEAGVVPKWACAFGERPANASRLPTGVPVVDARAAKAEVEDARDATHDALRLHNVAGLRGTDRSEAAADNADAKALLKDASREAAEAKAKLRAVKAEVAQKVPAVNAATLAGEVQAAGPKGALVTFYAPWCGHCKRFVLYGEDDDPAKAPIELLSADLVAAGGPKVLKFDIDASALPTGYDVQFIPTVYLVDQTGAKAMYQGDPHDVKGLKAFALAGVEAAAQGDSETMTVLHAPIGLHAQPAKAGKAAASLLQVGARRTRPWNAISDEISVMTGQPTLAQQKARAAKESALQEQDARGGAAGQVWGPGAPQSLGAMSQQLDGQLELSPGSALDNWVHSGRAMPKQKQDGQAPAAAAMVQTRQEPPESQYLHDLQ